MLGSFFGTCCNAPAVEGELRVGDQNNGQQQHQQEAQQQRRKGASGAASGGGSGSKAKPKQQLPRYKIDNTYLQIQGPPGVSYRYSKSLDDKVVGKKGIGPAKWGDIVEGIDEGDGWLKVGEYYLPMTYNKKPVVTPVAGTESVPSKQDASAPSRTAGSSEASAASAAPSTAAPSEAPMVAASGGSVGALGKKEASSPDARSAPKSQERPVPPAAIAPQSSVEKKEVIPKPEVPKPEANIEPKIVPKVDHVAQDIPAKPCSEILQSAVSTSVSPKAEIVGWVADFSQDAVKDIAKDIVEPVKEITSVSPQRKPWNKRPSVGTWLQIPIVDQAAEPAALTATAPRVFGKEPYNRLPSVGTWLCRPVKVKCVQ